MVINKYTVVWFTIILLTNINLKLVKRLSTNIFQQKTVEVQSLPRSNGS